MRHTTKAIIVLAVAVALLTAFVIGSIRAIPSGASLTLVSNSTSNGTTPSARNDSGGYIYVTNMNTVQQDANWKAYVGNVTGSLTLDDAQNYTIYNWDTGTPTGEVYSTRNSSVKWTTIGCAGTANFQDENTFFGFGATAADNVNDTFNATKHRSFVVGTHVFSADSCRSTALYINDTRQLVTTNSLFQEITLSDGYSLVYAAPMELGKYGYNFLPYDFQMILPENGTSVATTTYYFWVELT